MGKTVPLNKKLSCRRQPQFLYNEAASLAVICRLIRTCYDISVYRYRHCADLQLPITSSQLILTSE